MLLTPGGTATVDFWALRRGVPVAAANPGAVIYKGSTLTAIAPTIANPQTGLYQVSFTVPSNWVDFDSASVVFTGTIDGLETSFSKSAGTVASVFSESDRTKLEEVHRFDGLDTGNPITTNKTGDTTTETDGSVTITHSVDTVAETVISQRSG